MALKLYAHQQKILSEDPKKCGLWLGTSGGKTALGLLLAHGTTLVVAPKSVVEDKSWEREMERICLSIPLTVISKEKFRSKNHLLPCYNTVIFDECHTICGATPATYQRNYIKYPKTSQLFTAAKNYLEKTKPERLYLLSATPDRSPMTVWAAGQLLGRDWNFESFRKEFYQEISIGRANVWMVRHSEQAKESLGNYVRALGYVGRLSDWFDLPPQIHKLDAVMLTDDQLLAINKQRLLFPDVMQFANKAHQIENGILIGDAYMKNERFENAKISKILDYTTEFRQLLIFAKYTEQIASIADALRKADKKVLTLEGSTPDKGAVIAEANSSPDCVVIAQSQISSGYGLPTYPCTIFASLSGSLVDLVQGQGRTLRTPKLESKLNVYLVAGNAAKYKSRDMKRYIANVVNAIDYHEEIYENV